MVRAMTSTLPSAVLLPQRPKALTSSISAPRARADGPARDADEEAQIVAAAADRIVRETALPVSVDTYKPPVAAAALDAGASIINDIGGLRYDDGIAREAARRDGALVVNFT